MHFFLQGQRGVGKSHLLQEVLRPFMANLSGYQVQRIFENGEPMGFRVQNIRHGFPVLDAHDTSCSDDVFLYRGRRDMSVLERLILEVERSLQPTGCSLILLDEIGGMELCSDTFMDGLYRILNSGNPCIGVFKSAGNLTHLVSELGLEDQYSVRHQRLEDFLRAHGELFTLTKENRELCKARLTAFLSKSA